MPTQLAQDLFMHYLNMKRTKNKRRRHSTSVEPTAIEIRRSADGYVQDNVVHIDINAVTDCDKPVSGGEDNEQSEHEPITRVAKHKKKKKKHKRKAEEVEEEEKDIGEETDHKRPVSEVVADDNSNKRSERLVKRKKRIAEQTENRETGQKFYDVPINSGKLSTSPLHTEFPNLWWQKEQRKQAKRLGLKVRGGQFTKEEEEILTANWRQFCDDFPVDNPYLFLGYFKSAKDEDEMTDRKIAKKVIKESELYLRLGKGLPDRPLIKVYQRARVMFSGLKSAADLTEDDRTLILRLHRKGVKNVKIAHKVFAEVKVVLDVIRYNVSKDGNCRPLKKLRWSEEDSKRLLQVVTELMDKRQISDVIDIPWPEVALLMRDRNERQCRQHFFSHTFHKYYDPESENSYRHWNIKDTQKLVYYLHNNKIRSEKEIDWDFLKVKFSEFIFRHLVRRWKMLKYSVPDFRNKSFSDIVRHLYDKYLDRVMKDETELEEFCQ